jgi:ElaB/YqjD/DUF883 family membrane-anchored ribosome-binding protein
MDTDRFPDDDSPKAVSQLSESMAQTAESQRALLQDMTHFAKEESLRFMNLRLERNGAALDKLQNCRGLPGLLGVQQEWLRDLVQDYMSQNMRLAGAFRGVAQNVVASAAETASQTVDRMQQEAGEMAEQAGEQMNRAAETVENYVQETQH